MGKSKSRIFRKGINDQFTTMTRESAVTETAKFLNSRNITEAHNLITMFGLTAEEILEADHYGLEKVKDRIIEYLAVLKLKGDMKSPILCLYGPPGVGKTSLGK